MFQLNFRPPVAIGRVVIAPAAAERLSLQDVSEALRRHLRGDPGDFGDPLPPCRRSKPPPGCRLFSAYRALDGTRFWVITETDARITTVLLPEDE